MMSDLEKARRAYAKDITALRKKKGVTLDMIYNETRILRSILVEYEKDGLYHNASFHKVYLQFMTRAYATVIGLDIDQVMMALDMALEGTYDGRLSPEPQPKPSRPPDKKPASARAPKRGASSPRKDKRTEGGEATA